MLASLTLAKCEHSGCFACRYSLLLAPLAAQPGGAQAFQLLRQPSSAFVSGLGGINISSGGWQSAAFLANPALNGHTSYNSERSSYKQLSVSIAGAPAGLSTQTLAYTFGNQQQPWAVGLQAQQLGLTDRYDAAGNLIGTFNATEWVLAGGRSFTSGPFRLGASAKIAHSSLDSYFATAALLSAGGLFSHPETDLVVAIAVQNAGFWLSRYSATTDNALPIELQAGISFKPEGFPLRLSLTGQQLQRGSLAYINPQQTSGNLLGNNEPESVSTFGEIARHLVFGAELNLSESLYTTFGYNVLQRSELSLPNRSGFSGFAFGFGFQAKWLQVQFAHNGYFPGKGTTNFSLLLNLPQLLGKVRNN